MSREPIDVLSFIASSPRGRLLAQLHAATRRQDTMTITIRLDTGNDAFTDYREAEIARILSVWVARGCQAGPLPLDFNGNRVGTVKITGR